MHLTICGFQTFVLSEFSDRTTSASKNLEWEAVRVIAAESRRGVDPTTKVNGADRSCAQQQPA